MHCIGYATCVYTINCALSNQPSFGIGVYFFLYLVEFLKSPTPRLRLCVVI